MNNLLFVAIGGALGSLGRYVFSGFIQRLSGFIFPVGTLAVNLIGSFIIGLLWGFFENSNLTPQVRTFVFVGMLGGFTTFSSFSIETLNLLRDGAIKLACLNIILNNVAGIGLAFLGFALVKQLQP